MPGEGTVGQKATSRKNPLVGRKKGGKMFPRLGLEQAVAYSKRLVSKTAISAQPESTVLAGVFDNATSEGKIRLSAVKQFGFLEGTAKGYSASQLAKDIDTAADDAERLPLLRRSVLNATIFNELYNTFQGDQASKAKVRGRAQQLGVHPDSAEACTEIFVGSSITAKLATVEGDGIRLLPATQINQLVQPLADSGEAEEMDSEPLENGDAPLTNPPHEVSAPAASLTEELEDPPPGVPVIPRPRTAADVSINLTVDSSLDGDKLEKHLNLLRRFGLI